MWFILDKKSNVVCGVAEKCDDLKCIINAHSQIEIPDDEVEDWMYTAKYKKDQLIDCRPYNLQRQFEYPEIGEQLDVIWKQLESMGIDQPDAKKIKKVIDDIKIKYPKK